MSPKAIKLREDLGNLGLKHLSIDVPRILRRWGDSDDFWIYVDSVKTSSTYKAFTSDNEKRGYLARVIRSELKTGEGVGYV